MISLVHPTSPRQQEGVTLTSCMQNPGSPAFPKATGAIPPLPPHAHRCALLSSGGGPEGGALASGIPESAPGKLLFKRGEAHKTAPDQSLLAPSASTCLVASFEALFSPSLEQLGSDGRPFLFSN